MSDGLDCEAIDESCGLVQVLGVIYGWKEVGSWIMVDRWLIDDCSVTDETYSVGSVIGNKNCLCKEAARGSLEPIRCFTRLPCRSDGRELSAVGTKTG